MQMLSKARLVVLPVYPVLIPEITMMSTFILSKVIPIIRKLDEKW